MAARWRWWTRPGWPRRPRPIPRWVARKPGSARFDEHLAVVHLPASGDHADDDRHPAGWPDRLPHAAGGGIAAGGLPDHPRDHAVPRCPPLSDDLRRYGAARTSINQ